MSEYHGDYEFACGRLRFLIPGSLVQTLWAYANERRPVYDDFLEAIICNDFVRAAQRADMFNIQNLPAYAAWLYNEAPASCWGSVDKMKKWLAGEVE